MTDSTCRLNVWKKLSYFIVIQLVALAVAIGVLAICFAKSSGLVLLTMPFLVGGCALIGWGFWWWRFKDLFESVLVYITGVSLLFAFLLCAPFVVERSLSCFVYFAAVEDGSVAPSQISPAFTEPFVQKRFDDGVRGHFLEKKGEVYVATPRSRLFYAIYYPLGKLTNTLSNYRQFKQALQKQGGADDTL